MSTQGVPAKLETRTLVSVSEAATMLSVSTKFVWLEIERGQLPAVRLGRRVLVHMGDLDQYIRAHRQTRRRQPQSRA